MSATCIRTCTTLWRGFGHWPTAEFKDVPEYVEEHVMNGDRAVIRCNWHCCRVCGLPSPWIPYPRGCWFCDERPSWHHGRCCPRPRASLAAGGVEDQDEVDAARGGCWIGRYYYEPIRTHNEARDQDIRWGRMAGKCYRLPIESDGKQTTVGRTRKEEAAVDGNKSGKKRKVS